MKSPKRVDSGGGWTLSLALSPHQLGLWKHCYHSHPIVGMASGSSCSEVGHIHGGGGFHMKPWLQRSR